jgi:hypothetical protein
LLLRRAILVEQEFGRALVVPRRVIKRQRMPRCDAGSKSSP